MKCKPQVKIFLLNSNVSVSNQLTMLFKEKQIEFKHDMAFMELIKVSLYCNGMSTILPSKEIFIYYFSDTETAQLFETGQYLQ